MMAHYENIYPSSKYMYRPLRSQAPVPSPLGSAGSFGTKQPYAVPHYALGPTGVGFGGFGATGPCLGKAEAATLIINGLKNILGSVMLPDWTPGYGGKPLSSIIPVDPFRPFIEAKISELALWIRRSRGEAIQWIAENIFDVAARAIKIGDVSLDSIVDKIDFVTCEMEGYGCVYRDIMAGRLFDAVLGQMNICEAMQQQATTATLLPIGPAPINLIPMTVTPQSWAAYTAGLAKARSAPPSVAAPSAMLPILGAAAAALLLLAR